MVAFGGSRGRCLFFFSNLSSPRSGFKSVVLAIVHEVDRSVEFAGLRSSIQVFACFYAHLAEIIREDAFISYIVPASRISEMVFRA